jgi:iron-sulfur cluster repair protein YtfE (RIC family)
MITHEFETSVTAFAQGQHRELVRGINRIHDVGCEIGHRPTRELSLHILGILDWLHGVLEPHLAWEETSLYPEIDRFAGSPWATRGARFEHQQLRELTTRLRADRTLLTNMPQSDRHGEALADLFGLEALLRAHIEAEERFLIPVLLDGPQLDASSYA